MFGNTSLELATIKYQNKFEIRPPIKRGDFDLLIKEQKAGCVLITDGIFGQELSVSPVECLRMLRAGWIVLGSSSMGALRAADCCNGGMIGVGDIYMGYKLGYFKSDADVAVLYSGVDGSEVTMSYVHADYVGRVIARSHQLSTKNHRVFMSALRKIPWYSRSKNALALQFSYAHYESSLARVFMDLSECADFHPKKLDALLACDYLWSFYQKKVHL